MGTSYYENGMEVNDVAEVNGVSQTPQVLSGMDGLDDFGDMSA